MDQTILCYECGKLLRNELGKDIEDIHSSVDGEDVCRNCCEFCNGKATACEDCNCLLVVEGVEIAPAHEVDSDEFLCTECFSLYLEECKAEAQDWR